MTPTEEAKILALLKRELDTAKMNKECGYHTAYWEHMSRVYGIEAVCDELRIRYPNRALSRCE